MPAATLDEVDDQLRAVISNYYMLLVQSHDFQGQQTMQAMTTEAKRLLLNLQTLGTSGKTLPHRLPRDIIQYVEQSRNPDIYTRDFVEVVMRYNQQQQGRSNAFAQFRDILGSKMMAGIPDIRDDVKQIVEATGGHV